MQRRGGTRGGVKERRGQDEGKAEEVAEHRRERKMMQRRGGC